MNITPQQANKSNINIMMSLILLGFGMHCILRGIVLPAIKEELGITFTQSGLLLGSVTAAFFIMTMLSGKISEKLGQRVSMSVYTGGLVVTAVMTTFANSFALLLAVFFVSGACYGGIECVLTAIIRRYNSIHTKHVMNKIFRFYCIGSIIAALTGGWFVYSGLGWRASFLIVAVICLVGFVYSLLLIEKRHESTPPINFSQIGKLMRNKPFLISCAAIALLSGAETSTHNWLTTFLTAGADMNIFHSSCIVALFAAAMYLGRHIYARILRRYNAPAIAAVSSFISGLLIMSISVILNEGYIFAAMIAFGISISCLYPLMVTLTSELSNENLVYSFTFMSISIGNFIVNYSLGIIADHIGVHNIFRLNAIILVVAGFLIIINRNNYDRTVSSDDL